VTWRDDVGTVRSRLVPKWARQEGTERAYQSTENAALARLEERLERYERDVEVAVAEIEKQFKRAHRYETALRPFVDDYDFHAADYLAEFVDGEEARVLTARTIDELIALQRVARAALAEGQDG